MKRLLFLISFVILATPFAIGQKGIQGDPSYSVHNYKHPNKAAYAKKHDLDKSVTVVSGTGKRNDDYKHNFGNRKSAPKSVVRVKTEGGKQRGDYKHPYGF